MEEQMTSLDTCHCKLPDEANSCLSTPGCSVRDFFDRPHPEVKIQHTHRAQNTWASWQTVKVPIAGTQ